jgi:hypothetical protein
MDAQIHSQAFKTIAARIVSAEDRFLSALSEIGDISPEDAVKVFNYYSKHKLLKRSNVVGHVTVKHGAFLEKDVIRNALSLCS